MTESLRVGIVGYGVIGRRRAAALGGDRVVAVVDPAMVAGPVDVPHFGDTAQMCTEMRPDVVVVATPHHALNLHTVAVLSAGCHVLVEKPAALTLTEFDAAVSAAESFQRRLWVGYNHRHHPGIRRLVAEATSGAHGRVMYIRARYGHGGRVGYDREWRARPELSGGGELMDQGGHLLDLVHAILGPVPLMSALLRTAFWDMPVEDNAVLTLAHPGVAGAWANLELSCTEWKNEFVFDVYCERARLTVTGLSRSYGPQRLTIHRMKPEMGPPETEVVDYPAEDQSWAAEWRAFRAALRRPFQAGDCESARYALDVIGAAYHASADAASSS
jgi:predicted dehydrogenase